MKIESWQQKLAWQNALELRACPDDNILFSKRQTSELRDHLKMCRLCVDRLSDNSNDEAWKELVERLTETLPKPTQSTKPAVGQLWTLSRKLNGWGSGSTRYYKAPMVLLVEEISGASYGFKVTQVYTNRLLMGPKDVWLGDDIGFAEAWHTYSIHKSDLEFCWGNVDSSLVKAVIEESGRDSQNAQEPAKMEQCEIPEDSILYSFRNLEVEVGSHCARQSVAKLVEAYEAQEVQVPVMSNLPELTIWEQLNNKIKKITGYWEPDWVGIQATATDTPDQENTFRLENGEIEISCYWKAQYGKKPSYINIKWNANVQSKDELWLVFIKPGEESLLTEICLGRRLEGEENFSSKILGFDPSREKWAMSIYLKEKQD